MAPCVRLTCNTRAIAHVTVSVFAGDGQATVPMCTPHLLNRLAADSFDIYVVDAYRMPVQARVVDLRLVGA